MDSTTAIDTAVAQLAHRGIVDVTRVHWHPRTAGPAVISVHGTTGRRLFVGWDPTSATYTVECDGSSWSWVRADRLQQAITYHVDHWSDTWQRLTERNEHLCTIGRP